MGSILNLIPMLLWCVFRRLMGNGGSAINVFRKSVRKYPNNEALVYTPTDKRYTYKELDEEINKAAHWLFSHDIKQGQVISIMLDNSPEFIIFWLAAMKLGVVTSCINTTLKSMSILQSIETVTPSIIIFHAKYRPEFKTVVSQSDPSLKFFEFPDGTTPTRDPTFHQVNFSNQPKTPPPVSWVDSVKVDDIALLIYTSGTTGNPKPAILTNAKISGGSVLLNIVDLKESDRLYCSLPLYHSSPAVLGWGSCFSRGATLILAPKFSASRFIPDCIAHKATAMLYIGELCRFLCNTPPSPQDRQHNIRVAVGNGMRPDVWTRFVDRFGVSEVFEFYGSSEGNANMFNYWKLGEKGVGAVGKLTWLTEWMNGIRVVEKGEDEDLGPLRGEDGFCKPCKVGEVGELVSVIDDKSLTKAFKGYYKDRVGSEKKVLKDVFRKGDKYFRTGDTVWKDADGFVYFSDRIGDTFRWKGENVSTLQVAGVIHAFPGVLEANVYGVLVPGSDGRAGMVALNVSSNIFEVGNLGEFLLQRLPRYAVPIWIRLLRNGVDDEYTESHTGTLKQKKVEYRNQGFNHSLVNGDVLFWMKPGTNSYVLFTEQERISVIVNGLN